MKPQKVPTFELAVIAPGLNHLPHIQQIPKCLVLWAMLLLMVQCLKKNYFIFRYMVRHNTFLNCLKHA